MIQICVVTWSHGTPVCLNAVAVRWTLRGWFLMRGCHLPQVQQFTGGLDRDVSVLLKRVQNLQATIRP